MQAEAYALFGDAALSEPELLSPPNLEKLGPKGKAFVKEFAYTPFTGLTIAPRSDNREEVAPRPDGAETFAHAVVDTAPAES